ncbi:MAG: pentapeptide repeat-containing protein [Elainellaceae cyanobacterium]
MSRDALVVGINTYQHLHPLSAPAADAESIAQCLETHGDFDMVRRLPERITRQGDRKIAAVHEERPVSQLELKHALKHLFRPDSNQAPDTALFYFSGHGIPDHDGYDKGYLATTDTNPAIPESGLSLRWLQWLLSESPVKQQIIWLDCCHSGGLLVSVDAANPGHGERRDRCFIASSRDFEQSWQDLNSPYSVLTKALLDGLDPTRLHGRWVDSFALVDYVNQALKGELQKPICTNFGEAINLTRTWQVEQESLDRDADVSDVCPYKGLEFFDFNDEDPKYFFGREQLTGQLLDRVRTSSFIALVGASGNGKSSVLRAGLLHQLQIGHRIAGSDQWRIRITRPDRQPLRNLALAFVDADAPDLERAEQLGKAERLIEKGADGLRRLVQTDTAPKVILVVDQFEEVFTRCDNVEEREQFFACLMGALSETDDKLCLIIALRADFIGKCLERDYSGLANRIQQDMVNVLPMEPDNLRDAICKPAEQVGLTVEPALLTEILNDIAGAPGSLPLLQYTLKELWQRCQGNQLVLSAYQTLGGINGTLNQRATEIYSSFDEAEQRTVQHIFQQLTQLGEGTEDTRRRVFLDALIAEPQHPAERVNQVIATLASPENRLLVTSEVISKGNDAERMAIVDVAHEALIRHWRLLRQWIEQNRDLLRQQRRIEASAVAWREYNRAKGYLLQGLPLVEATQFQKQQNETFPLSDPAKNFIQKSVQQRRWNRLKTASWLILPIIILDYSFHTLKVEQYYASINRTDKEAQSTIVLFLLKDCLQRQGKPTGYLIERFGRQYCRSMQGKRLRGADFRDADFRDADFRDADFRDADLFSANFSYANLRKAGFHDADLRFADLVFADLVSANFSYTGLRNANLRAADLSSSILLSTDFRESNNLSVDQFTGDQPPLLCNVALPSHITDSGVNPDRDCDKMPQVLSDRSFNLSLEEAQQIVDEARQKQW